MYSKQIILLGMYFYIIYQTNSDIAFHLIWLVLVYKLIFYVAYS